MKPNKTVTLICIGFFILALSQCKKDQIITTTISSVPHGQPYNLVIPQGFPRPFIPIDNPFTEEVIKLGRYIFHDKRLSKDNSMSCASCHFQFAAFTDGLPKSIGIKGLEVSRNSMPLFNLAWQEHFFWDGRAMSLEEQALMPIEDPLELDNTLETVISRFEKDTLYPQLFEDAFGDPTVSKERIAKAIAQFERIIVSANSEFDSVKRLKVKPTFSNPAAERGFELFENEIGDCSHCHGIKETAFLMGSFGIDLQFLNNGLKSETEQLQDIGRERETGVRLDRGRFKNPSVRNSAFSLPFMHDGSIPDLDSLIGFYEKGVHITLATDANILKNRDTIGDLAQKTWQLHEKAELIAFLKSLSDFKYLGDTVNYGNPFNQ